MKILPEFLFHAAPMCVRDSIEADGLRSQYGELYAAEKPEHALTFMAFRLYTHIHGMQKLEITIPILVEHPEVDVWMIDVAKTDLAKWQAGSDHSAAFFGEATSLTYSEPIPRSALIGRMSFKESDLITG
jgi:hypothetical protein